MAVIELSDVSKVFGPTRRGERPVTAVDGVPLRVEAGQIAGIIGHSGAGKSTVVRLVNGLEKPSSGTVTVDGTTITGLPERRLRAVRLGIGMIFQQFNLFSSRTVWGNVAYPLRVAKVPTARHRERISELLHFVGLADRAHSYPDQLSGGQKQRVGIARALATSPKVLLADEATSALDPETTRDVLALLRKVNVELGVTIVVITHEMAVVRSIADRVVVMERGRVVEDGPAFDVFSQPAHPTTQRFVRTVVDDVPTGATLESLRANHSGRIVSLSYRDGSRPGSEVFAELISAGVGFELVHGGLADVRGRSFGTLTLALSGPDAAVDHAIGRLRDRAAVTEVA
ncbi:methionine ABC transporter ATP-binding protein [Actinophytocola xinjiangensis]|uniref:Methionine ABC transporter ATP-binding protein n=1 Tax=Actinophytocola xinjiangensis TaxID=485602 RepID=A0A7Z0WQL2_9PSEU|nr:methionine ABC transporter ATP-binding protein [Actinophytocola xinjiangensis]OLF11959.1 methionine ABC transporter ATP-binding protein [Actinophytocola xinjiangensis]